MAEQLLETQPLRERFREAERLTRELIQHLELGFMPKMQEVRRIARKATTPNQMDDIADNTIRTSVDAVLTSHEYSLDLTRKLERYLQSIEKEVNEIVVGSSPQTMPRQRG